MNSDEIKAWKVAQELFRTTLTYKEACDYLAEVKKSEKTTASEVTADE